MGLNSDWSKSFTNGRQSPGVVCVRLGRTYSHFFFCSLCVVAIAISAFLLAALLFVSYFSVLFKRSYGGVVGIAVSAWGGKLFSCRLRLLCVFVFYIRRSVSKKSL